jgi:hypothetical protein
MLNKLARIFNEDRSGSGFEQDLDLVQNRTESVTLVSRIWMGNKVQIYVDPDPQQCVSKLFFKGREPQTLCIRTFFVWEGGGV